MLSLDTQSNRETDGKETHRHLCILTDAKGWYKGETWLSGMLLIISDWQRPLGRITFELPPKRGKGAGYWKYQQRNRGKCFRKKEQLAGTP